MRDRQTQESSVEIIYKHALANNGRSLKLSLSQLAAAVQHTRRGRGDTERVQAFTLLWYRCNSTRHFACMIRVVVGCVRCCCIVVLGVRVIFFFRCLHLDAAPLLLLVLLLQGALFAAVYIAF